MIPLTPIVKLIAGAVLVVLALFGASWAYERSRGVTTAQLDTARAHTQAAELIAAKAETVFVEKKAAAVAARVVFRTLRDSALAHLTDTVLVRETIRKADTTIVRDSVALLAAEKALVAEKGHTDSVKKELALAMKPHFAPRFSGSASGLYDPIAKASAASVTGEFRIIGPVSLTTQYHQRFAPDEKPRFYAGVGVRF